MERGTIKPWIRGIPADINLREKAPGVPGLFYGLK